jgi:hypothetical protein
MLVDRIRNYDEKRDVRTIRLGKNAPIIERKLNH